MDLPKVKLDKAGIHVGDVLIPATYLDQDVTIRKIAENLHEIGLTIYARGATVEDVPDSANVQLYNEMPVNEISFGSRP